MHTVNTAVIVTVARSVLHNIGLETHGQVTPISEFMWDKSMESFRDVAIPATRTAIINDFA